MKKDYRHVTGINELSIKFKNINVAFTDLLFDSETFRKGFEQDQQKQKEAIEQLGTIRKRLEDKCDIAEVRINAKRQ